MHLLTANVKASSKQLTAIEFGVLLLNFVILAVMTKSTPTKN